MTPITTRNDYVGAFEISKNELTYDNIDASILRVEESRLTKLLGVELKALYLANLTNPLYTKIRDPFVYQGDCGIFLESQGIKEMMKGFVYFDYFKQSDKNATLIGLRGKKAENSDNKTDLNDALQVNYNNSVRTYKAIQEYFMLNRNDYPTFKGIELKYLQWF